MGDELPHLTESGDVHMVDVSTKNPADRVAVAEAIVLMAGGTADLLFGDGLPKGDALATVRVAAIMGAKRTPELVPLCHPVALTAVSIDVERVATGARIVVTAKSTGQTGVEMEAMTGAMIGALTMYDMVKGVERSVEIGPVRLLAKSGGKSGTWTRTAG
jgi:cyclic pyranopterin phosphate synthase